ncbi:N-acetylmuramoyl-L-alanine amidase [Solibacillus silvestris StLB046]|uniref:N-acetylmuramoyl-L-alanine amidase n=1 Tax=Solibacillus silvestris (strain StLB046) TaxID=1002809 RepID=F2F2N2_SOLSS|nr:N-acetylmuramoyl-L-alanine amidase [Solibacillus silvestris]BAK15870.1 N-acetylmuramoyl-L-alanine amidase [Solibacillus silvestris StLB046]
MITISPGHYGPKTGAHGLIDEGTENIRVAKEVTAILLAAGITTNYIEDNVSKSAKQNIPWLIAMHNKTDREIDVSIHFNSSPGTHSRGIGTETLVYSDKNKEVAKKITDAIANASGLKNRGVKVRTDLGLLKGTNKPCYLIEVCFVNDSVDVALYRRDFDKICRAIANELAKAVGKSLKPSTTSSTVEDKGARKLDINSPSLNDLAKSILESKAKREILVNYAIAEGMHKSWLDKLNNRTITNDEILVLAAAAIVNSKV